MWNFNAESGTARASRHGAFTDPALETRGRFGPLPVLPQQLKQYLAGLVPARLSLQSGGGASPPLDTATGAGRGPSHVVPFGGGAGRRSAASALVIDWPERGHSGRA